MRRLGGVLFTLCSAVSLLLCLAVSALWADSYLTAREVHRDGQLGGYWRVESKRGRLAVESMRMLQPFDPDADIVRPGTQYRLRGIPGVDVQQAEGRMRPRTPGETPPYRMDLPTTRYGWFTQAWLSYWLVCAASAVLPMVWLRRAGRRRRQARAARNLCRACGYDLRATPERCPECGTAPTS